MQQHIDGDTVAAVANMMLYLVSLYYSHTVQSDRAVAVAVVDSHVDVLTYA